MKTCSPAIIALAALLVGGCNLTYDREALKFDEGPACDGATPDLCDLGAGPFCTDFDTDSGNCGACGTTCAPGTPCTGGTCAAYCDFPYAECGRGNGYVCTDLDTDPFNCSACGTVCGIGSGCSTGICDYYCGASSTCPAGLGYVCADTLNDPKNCGGCGVDCGTHSCLAGFCDVTCSGATPDRCVSASSGPFCTYWQTDGENCGFCGNSCGLGTCANGTCIGGPTLPAVAPLFPLTGANWNDWVGGTDWGATTGVACDPTFGLPCFHAGEHRVVPVVTEGSCLGLVAYDALGFFDWVCDDGLGYARLISTGLKPGIRLGDLISPSGTAFRINTLYVEKYGFPLAYTPASAWWNNVVAPVPANGQLTGPGTIYFANGAVAPPYAFVDSAIALAVPTGAYLGTVPNTTQDVVGANSLDFLWVEGDFDATGANHGVFPAFVRYSVFRNVSVTRPRTLAGNVGLYLYQASRNRVERYRSAGSTYGVYLDQSTATENRLQEIDVVDADQAVYLQYAERNALSQVRARRSTYGVMLSGARQNTFTGVDVSSNVFGLWIAQPNTALNTFTDVAAAANSQVGVYLNNAGSNRFEGVSSTQNGSNGVELVGSQRSVFVDLLTAHNASAGLWVNMSYDNVFVQVTSARNLAAGLELVNDASHNFLAAVRLDRNGTQGAVLENATANTLVDIGIAGSGGPALVELGTSTDNAFRGRLALELQSCQQSTSGVNPAFNFSCGVSGLSDFTLAMLGPFLYPPVTSETANLSWQIGVPPVTDLDADGMDWSRFDHPHRSWGSPSTGALGCDGDRSQRSLASCPFGWIGGGTIVDWSRAVGDAAIQLPAPTLGSYANHTWSDMFTVNAIQRTRELLGDGLGNDDGLCVTGEVCLATPNYGAYQGHGALIFFGNVSGSDIWSLEFNGR